MNPIKYLSDKLEENKIDEYFSSFKYKTSDFKIKFFSPIVFGFNFIWSSYLIFGLNIKPTGFNDWLLFLFFGCLLQPSVILLAISYLTPINGHFFKSISEAFR